MYKPSIVPYNAWGWRLAPSLDTEDVIQFIMSNSLLEDVVNDQLLINIFWRYPLYRGRYKLLYGVFYV
jgi:hypothetical protein